MKKNECIKEKEIKNHKDKIIWKMFTISIAFIVVGSCLVLYLSMNGLKIDNQEDYEKTTIKSLSLSPIVSGTEGTIFLEQEAGISAYTNIGSTINLNLAKNAFRTIEKETTDYIIGSVSLPDYAETEDVHCYVHKDGWIVSYYLKDEPAAKIVDWENYGTDEKITGTKLEVGIVVVCDAANVLKGEIKYYDFRYPNANKLMVIADAQWTEGTDTFDIKLPGDFVFYERSFSHCNQGKGMSSRMNLDDNLIVSLDAGKTNQDFLTASQLSVDEFHTIKITASHDSWSGTYSYPTFGAIVLIYKEG